MCEISEEEARILNMWNEMHDRLFLFVCPRGNYNEQPETPAEKRQREQAIQLIRKYEANHHRTQTNPKS